MAGYTNFDRQYRLIAGPAGKTGFEVGATSPSQPEPLHITFRLEKSDLETQNTGKIEIWNLSPSHVAELEKADCCVGLRAGYGNNLPLIFAGIVSFATSTKDGADVKTSIEVVDNLIAIRDTNVSISYKGTVSWKTIFDDIAAQIGVVPVYSYNATFANVTNGFSYVGLAKNVLTKGCNCCGLSWSIQNGVLQIKRAGDAVNTKGYLLSAETGLIGTPEKVAVKDSNDSSITRIGWDVTFFLNGAIDVNDYVKLVSKQVTGYFYVYSIQINGDNKSGDWTCKARLLELSKVKPKASSGGGAASTTVTYKVKTNGGRLMLRESAGYTKILAKMPNGTTVSSDGKSSGEWIHVCYNGTWGYSHQTYLQKV